MVIGAAVRLTLLRWPRLWYDEATTGIMGLAVLRGELPVYFFGQPFMGALDAYLAAPLYVALGVSARTLELGPVLLALVWLGLVVRLAWDAFGPRAALFTAILLAIPPDFALYWAHEARPHYPLSTVLGTLALLLALRAPGATPRRTALCFGLLGFVLGLALWTNLLSLVYVLPAGVLALRRGLRPVVPGCLVALPAFLLGSLPHWLYGLQRGTALPPPGHRIALAELIAHVGVFGRVSWPILIGVPAGLRDGAWGVIASVALAMAYVAALVAAARAVRHGGSPARGTRLALLVLVAVNVSAAVGTEYGGRLDDHDQKYLLPLYTALPPLFGDWLGRLGAWPAAAALTGVVLVVHGADAATGSLRRPTAAARAAVDAERETIAALERAGPRRLYAPDPATRTLTFLSGERLIFANHYEEVYPPYARAVDAAPDAGWWTDRPSPVLEANLAALGVRFAFQRVSRLGGVYRDFALSPQGLREVDPAGLTVTASENGPEAGRVLDRDAATLWRTARPKRGGEWLQVDLGRDEPVALVRWLPGTYQEVPSGLRLDASVDGQSWRSLIELPQYVGPLYWSAGHPMARVRSGRVELRVPPGGPPARYLRVTQTGRDPIWRWSVRELFVYAATDTPSVAPGADGPALARAIRAAGVTRLYADHGWGARAATADAGIRVPPANLQLDAYGFRGSPIDLLPPFRWVPGSGALVEPADAEGFAGGARVAGLGFTRQAVGGLTLFAHAPVPGLPGTPLPRAALALTASRHPEVAPRALDGDPGTRWATGAPQAPGDWVRIDLAAPRVVRAVRLWTANPTDAPRGLALEGSADGVTWQPIAAELRTDGRLRWGGIALLRDGVEGVRLDFAPAPLRALRLVLTRGDPVFDWSIHELTVYAAD